MNCRITLLVLLYILGYNYCDEIIRDLNKPKGSRRSIFDCDSGCTNFPENNDSDDIEESVSSTRSKTKQSGGISKRDKLSEHLSPPLKECTIEQLEFVQNKSQNNAEKDEPCKDLQTKRYRIFPVKKSIVSNKANKFFDMSNLPIQNILKPFGISPTKKEQTDTTSCNDQMTSTDENLGEAHIKQTPLFTSIEKKNEAYEDSMYHRDIRLEILKLEELRERRRKQAEDELAFRKEKMREKVEEEREFSLIDPEEDQINTWDDTQIYKKTDPGKEKMLKFPHEIGSPKKIAIRYNPELKGYRQSDIDLSEMKSRQMKQDQELEFIETSQEAQHLFETAGSPFRRVKRGIKDPLHDEDMVVLDMPLGHTPDGLEDIVEEYFWGDFPSFNYERDRVNIPRDLAHLFEVGSNLKNILSAMPKHRLNVLEPDLKDLISIESAPSKDVKVLIAERRDLFTVKDRPFSLTRSISKGFKNIFMGRKSKKVKQKFLEDLRNAIIEWSDEYDKEFPMVTLSKHISPKIIKESLNSNELKNMNLDLRQKIEFMEEIFRKDAFIPEDSTLFDINLSKKLFPELKPEDIPDIKGIPVEELIVLSSSGILPNMGDFEYTVNSLRRELIEAERVKTNIEDPLDPRLVRRHVLIKELPPISANDDELALWEMEQREKMFQEEYDEHGHRKFKLSQLPLDKPVGLPDPKFKPSPEKKRGKVVVTDEDVQNLRKYEKTMYPEYTKKTDRLSREAELKKIAHVIDKRSKVEAYLKRTPTAFKSKIRACPSSLSESEEARHKRDKRPRELERPHTTAMTHLDKNLRKTVFDNSNTILRPKLGDDLNDNLELKDYDTQDNQARR